MIFSPVWTFKGNVFAAFYNEEFAFVLSSMVAIEIHHPDLNDMQPLSN